MILNGNDLELVHVLLIVNYYIYESVIVHTGCLDELVQNLRDES